MLQNLKDRILKLKFYLRLVFVFPVMFAFCSRVEYDLVMSYTQTVMAQ